MLRKILKFHKWVALIIGLQIAIWIAGGVVMSVIPIEKVRGEHKVAEPMVRRFDPTKIISLEIAAENAGLITVKEAKLGAVLDNPVWRLTDMADELITIDAFDGTVLSPITKELAQKIATADYSGKGQIVDVVWNEDPPGEYGPGTPVWIAQFNDRDNTTLYVNPNSAEVRGRRSTTWRFYDFFWKLHIMDYDDGENFNNNLLRVASFLGLLVAFSGLTLLFIRTRRSILLWRARKKEIL